jgi:hypothetical protein
MQALMYDYSFEGVMAIKSYVDALEAIDVARNMDDKLKQLTSGA